MQKYNAKNLSEIFSMGMYPQKTEKKHTAKVLKISYHHNWNKIVNVCKEGKRNILKCRKNYRIELNYNEKYLSDIEQVYLKKFCQQLIQELEGFKSEKPFEDSSPELVWTSFLNRHFQYGQLTLSTILRKVVSELETKKSKNFKHTNFVRKNTYNRTVTELLPLFEKKRRDISIDISNYKETEGQFSRLKRDIFEMEKGISNKQFFNRTFRELCRKIFHRIYKFEDRINSLVGEQHFINTEKLSHIIRLTRSQTEMRSKINFMRISKNFIKHWVYFKFIGYADLHHEKTNPTKGGETSLLKYDKMRAKNIKQRKKALNLCCFHETWKLHEISESFWGNDLLKMSREWQLSFYPGYKNNNIQALEKFFTILCKSSKFFDSRIRTIHNEKTTSHKVDDVKKNQGNTLLEGKKTYEITGSKKQTISYYSALEKFVSSKEHNESQKSLDVKINGLSIKLPIFLRDRPFRNGSVQFRKLLSNLSRLKKKSFMVIVKNISQKNGMCPELILYETDLHTSTSKVSIEDDEKKYSFFLKIFLI
jgi:hypothetical protein